MAYAGVSTQRLHTPRRGQGEIFYARPSPSVRPSEVSAPPQPRPALDGSTSPRWFTARGGFHLHRHGAPPRQRSPDSGAEKTEVRHALAAFRVPPHLGVTAVRRGAGCLARSTGSTHVPVGSPALAGYGSEAKLQQSPLRIRGAGSCSPSRQASPTASEVGQRRQVRRLECSQLGHSDIDVACKLRPGLFSTRRSPSPPATITSIAAVAQRREGSANLLSETVRHCTSMRELLVHRGGYREWPEPDEVRALVASEAPQRRSPTKLLSPRRSLRPQSPRPQSAHPRSSRSSTANSPLKWRAPSPGAAPAAIPATQRQRASASSASTTMTAPRTAPTSPASRTRAVRAERPAEQSTVPAVAIPAFAAMQPSELAQLESSEEGQWQSPAPPTLPVGRAVSVETSACAEDAALPSELSTAAPSPTSSPSLGGGGELPSEARLLPWSPTASSSAGSYSPLSFAAAVGCSSSTAAAPSEPTSPRVAAQARCQAAEAIACEAANDPPSPVLTVMSGGASSTKSSLRSLGSVKVVEFCRSGAASGAPPEAHAPLSGEPGSDSLSPPRVVWHTETSRAPCGEALKALCISVADGKSAVAVADGVRDPSAS
eukprot:TRINITY_DN14481_c0_g1_i1.p1 TRINITY_DN14481_c0_g1~~TRINITY_DN14481_c0_g1_i1.p1  ORF type:complete len:601 (-),score=80.61 TRINITY_DN14481_c0_g1_i1:328-2130(-)